MITSAKERNLFDLNLALATGGEELFAFAPSAISCHHNGNVAALESRGGAEASRRKSDSFTKDAEKPKLHDEFGA